MPKGSATFIHDPLWGDSGKGKVCDHLAEDRSRTVIFRYQGGNNAGHTIKAEGKVLKLHLVPSGILREDMLCLIGNGVVVNPGALLEEIEGLRGQGLPMSNLRVSPHAHLIMPYHIQMDHAEEEARPPEAKIGTTRRGIGPCYADKAARSGIRIGEALDFDHLLARVRNALIPKEGLLSQYREDILGSGLDMLDAEAIARRVHAQARELESYLADTTRLVWAALDRGEGVLGEGAQSTLLDIDHGTYPFVTSSNCLPAAAGAGIGLSPLDIERIIGVVKAYPTRIDTVGAFPSRMRESDPETEEVLIERGAEFGTTTGRKRRCGWNDAVALRYACRVSGITELALTKLDIMYDLPLRICVAYRAPDGTRIDDYPPDHRLLQGMEPIYEELPGFSGDISSTRSYGDLPQGARDYVEAIEAAVGLPVTFVGVGMGREEIIKR